MKNNEIQYIEFLSKDFCKVKEFYGDALAGNLLTMVLSI
jgi:hypothetical protein